MQIRPGIELAGLTDVGCVRENNEDSYSYWEPARDEEFPGKGRLLIVADGMGGHEGGQEASHIAVETVQQTYASAQEGDPRSWLLEGFRAAHEHIQQFAAGHPLLQGMGTTCSAVALFGNHFYYAHVGDSRLYLVRQSHIYRLSRDHSYVGRLVEQGIISPEEAATHPQRNILTAALGSGALPVPESPEREISVETGDVLLLCTDGLWGLVTDDEILKALSAPSLAGACAALVQQAKDRGGADNITVQAARVQAAAVQQS
ncbi:MAG TPA: Stp1/IreP family PP2C-type Ser/Thr phosphatase [Terriglobales bacterium]|nr:Stp1/IreP family PP2C-type Ser/Thr phosphatase [Terriglobales bacterium]